MPMTDIRQTFIAAGCAALALIVLSVSPTFAASGTHQFDENMQPVLASYLTIQKTLAADSIDGVHEAAAAIRKAASKLDATSISGPHAAHHNGFPAKLQEAAEALGKAPDLEAAREALKQLSEPMLMWAKMSHPDGIDALFCPMAKASWLQKHGDVRNPYLGKEMLGCGQPAEDAGHTMEGMEEMKHKHQAGH